ncbi:unnamed protein product [Soboliphyme baturini]|uniref:SP-RING-type domain-containing protein n=1 Tax=Soboliphyme baturini TaxID=241478 RepID=A0A183J0D5_9BILA|nr:unnamed protein product [Soboliphyme baturini]
MQSDRDPLTRLPLTEPVRNRFCGHVYERNTIREHIRRQMLNNHALYSSHLFIRVALPLCSRGDSSESKHYLNLEHVNAHASERMRSMNFLSDKVIH